MVFNMVEEYKKEMLDKLYEIQFFKLSQPQFNILAELELEEPSDQRIIQLYQEFKDLKNV